MDRYRQPSDLPSRIPVFPLRGAILLPRANLPLNIFEPRYLEMIDDVMSGARIIGMLQPNFGGTQTSEESPGGRDVALQRVGCAGRVTSYQELDDDRILITLTGICRFEVANEETTEKPYRKVVPNFMSFEADLMAGAGEEDVDRDKLLHVLKMYLDANKMSADWEGIQRASSEQLINALSIMSPFGAEEKQALVEARSLKERAEVLMALAEMEIASDIGGGGTIQ